jgi:hypothetical protein
MLILLLICFSFIELVISFMWLLLNLNLFNLSINLSYILFILTLTLLIFLYRVTLFVFLTSIFWIFLFGSVKVLLITFLIFTRVSTQHYLVCFWILPTLLYSNQVVSEWSYTALNLLNPYFSTFIIQNYITLKTNSIYLEMLNFSLVNNYFVDYIWGFTFSSAVISNQTFAHNLGLDKFYQVLRSFYWEFEHLVTTLDYNTTFLPLIIVLWGYISFSTLRNKNIIIF